MQIHVHMNVGVQRGHVQRPRLVAAVGEGRGDAAPVAHALQLLESAHDTMELMHMTGAEAWGPSASPLSLPGFDYANSYPV
jgi:hypothetical protein